METKEFTKVLIKLIDTFVSETSSEIIEKPCEVFTTVFDINSKISWQYM